LLDDLGAVEKEFDERQARLLNEMHYSNRMDELCTADANSHCHSIAFLEQNGT